MTPQWQGSVLAPENRRVDKTVKAECPNANTNEVERFKNGEEINEITCLETGEWDRQFDECERMYCIAFHSILNIIVIILLDKKRRMYTPF